MECVAAAFCLLSVTTHVVATFCFLGTETCVVVAFTGTAWVVVDGDNITAWPFYRLGLAHKELCERDVFAYCGAISAPLLSACVAAGGGFVPIACVAMNTILLIT